MQRLFTKALLFLALGAGLLMAFNLFASENDKLKAMVQSVSVAFPDVSRITANQVMTSDNLLLIDARSPQERAISTIPESIPLSDVKANVDAGEQKLVLFCTIGYRSSKSAQALSQKGYQVFNLEGGILGWAHAGGNLVTPEGQSTRQVHTYGPLWNLLPAGYQGVH